MRICKRSQFKTLFSTLCIFFTMVFVVYWFYKFEIEDRDIGVVDFLSLNEAHDVKIPVLAICFSNFILINSLLKANPAVTPQKFHEVLTGNIWDQQSMNTSFDDVTIDIKHYFINGFILDAVGNEITLNSSEWTHKNVFTGFHKHSIFMKCFATSIEKTNPDIEIKEIHLVYDKRRLLRDLGIPKDKSLPIYSTIFYPEQMFLEVEPMRTTIIQSSMVGLNVYVHGIEMLMRRNSRHKKCIENSEFYDYNLLRTHVENVGCKPFYLSGFDDIPVCKAQKDIRNSHIGMFVIRKMYFPKACKRLARINDEVRQVNDNWDRGYLYFAVIYPNEIKIITQSKEIDGHALIGNIGGYIGLFLGNEY